MFEFSLFYFHLYMVYIICFRVSKGLEDVSKYPNLFAELIRRGFSDEDVKKISRLNLIRVLQAVEKVSSEMQEQFPDNTLISPQPNGTCRPDF